MDTQEASEAKAAKPNHPVLYVLTFLILGVVYLISGFINIAARFGWGAYTVGAVVFLVLCAWLARFKAWAVVSATAGMGLGVAALIVSFSFWGY